MFLYNTTYKLINIDGHNVTAQIQIKYDYDDCSIEDSFDFGNKKENEKYLSRFESGELTSIYIIVTSYAEGEKGMNWLGGCHVTTRDIDKDINDTVKEYGMIDLAIEDLINTIKEKAKRLSKYNVPNFRGIRIHPGNTPQDTGG